MKPSTSACLKLYRFYLRIRNMYMYVYICDPLESASRLEGKGHAPVFIYEYIYSDSDDKARLIGFQNTYSCLVHRF